MKKFLLSFVALFAMASFAFAQENLLSNGDFEAWTDGKPDNWATTTTAGNATLSQSTDAHAGAASVLVKGASSNKRLGYKEITLKAGTYTYSFYAKAATEDGASVRPGYVPVTDGKVGSYVYDDNTYSVNNTEWTAISYEFTLDAQTEVNLVIMNSKNPGKDVLIDDCSLTTTDGGLVDGGTVEPEPEPTPEYASIAEIKAGGEGDAVLNLTNAVVTYVNGLNVYLEDATGGILVYTSGHGLEAGQAINGKVNVSYVLYGGTTAELTKFDASAATITDGNTIPVTEVSVAELLANTAKYESMRVKVSNAVVTAAFANRNASISQNGNEIGLYQKDKNATLGIAAGDKVHVVGYPGFYKTTPQLNVWEEGDITEDTSSISNALVGEKAAKVYSIDGRQLNSPAKGINIINGKKVLVK